MVLSKIVDDQGPDGLLEVGFSDRAKLFLASGIPDLQLDNLAVDFDVFGHKFDANRLVDVFLG